MSRAKGVVVYTIIYSVKETKNLSTSLLSSSFFVVHDSEGSGKDDESKLSRWKQVSNPVFNVFEMDIESWGNDSTLVETTDELNDDLSGAMVVDDFEFTNVT